MRNRWYRCQAGHPRHCRPGGVQRHEGAVHEVWRGLPPRLLSQWSEIFRGIRKNVSPGIYYPHPYYSSLTKHNNDQVLRVKDRDEFPMLVVGNKADLDRSRQVRPPYQFYQWCLKHSNTFLGIQAGMREYGKTTEDSIHWMQCKESDERGSGFLRACSPNQEISSSGETNHPGPERQ